MELLSSDRLEAVLRDALASQPLPKPADHRGGPATDMFIVSIARDRLDEIVEDVRDAVEHDRRSTRTQARGLGGFIAAWTEFQRYISEHEETAGHGATQR